MSRPMWPPCRQLSTGGTRTIRQLPYTPVTPDPPPRAATAAAPGVTWSIMPKALMVPAAVARAGCRLDQVSLGIKECWELFREFTITILPRLYKQSSPSYPSVRGTSRTAPPKAREPGQYSSLYGWPAVPRRVDGRHSMGEVTKPTVFFRGPRRPLVGTSKPSAQRLS